MINFEGTIADQKLRLTRLIMTMGGVVSVSMLFVLGHANATVRGLCLTLGIALILSQWLIGRHRLQKLGGFIIVAASTIAICAIVLDSKYPTAAGSHNLFPVIIAVAVILLGRYWGALTLGIVILFKLALIFGVFPSSQIYLQQTPDIFVVRFATIILIYGITVYAEHTTILALDKIREDEQKLRLQEKLAALGVFAGGISHEINNPLAVIKGYISQLKRWMLKEQVANDIQEKLERLSLNVQRITDIVHSLLALGHHTPLSGTMLTAFSVRNVVEEAQDIIRGKIDRCKNLVIENRVVSDLLGEGSANHLRIMLRIIIDNAIDALEIAAIADKRIIIDSCINNDDVVVTIEDNGPGIPENIIQNVFDPFFTTKEAGKGSGVGLALVARLCSSLKWTIEVESAPGQTKFTITLPMIQDENAIIDNLAS
ncbi:sensor histidine kinase [Pseudobacteriovorax antillogorgiicola]|uniref:histidine kinase n=1 Tax=Pseudobacteriovorax antillogorgiicola TaxID=1513793 RepID=A0A1Y6C810_9BACT|nr:HAMP domain-containing sensor histidine kinase [Pseudobacteriovorax antillogorgiicola]TCS51763.1 phospho-acceptor domain-containing protein [Pseudobacteriovorax antillogorgiicola]SMF49783.1 His Kinase A (phospho-acceptor) domain-containing protein [Pseudobacteriovorax antillogorgiicola]